MFKAFEYQMSTNVMYGEGIIGTVGQVVKNNGGQKVFVVTDPGIVKAGLLPRLTQVLETNGISFKVYSDVEPNPRVETIDKGRDEYVKSNCDMLIGFGGGSSLDVAKGVAMLVTNGGSMAEYAGAGKVKATPTKVIAIPTTAGTGSEVTANIAFTNMVKKDKMSCRSPLNYPIAAMLDPVLLSSLPASIAAATGMDALIHAVESYISKNASPVSEIIALEAIRMIGRNIRGFVANPADVEKAGNMILGSALAGMVIGNTGTGNCHGMARPVGGQYDVAHGIACAIIFAPVLNFNLESCPQKMMKIAEALGENVCGCNEMDGGRKAVEFVRELVADLKIPTTLTAVGVPQGAAEALAQLALANTGPNPRSTTYEDLVALFNEVM